MINGQPITLFLSCKVLFTLHVLIGIFFRGIPYLLQRGVDSLSHTAQCQWAASVDLLPCCKKSYSCGEAHFRSGLFVTQYRICVHTLDCHLRAAKKQQARRSSARGKLESSNESVLSTIISFQIYIQKKRDFTKKILKKSSPHYCLLRFLQNFFLKIAFF